MTKYKTAVIFAGGKSSRMGKDKALLPFGAYATLSEFQYKKLSDLFDKVYLSSKENKFDFNCLVITDNYIDNSPLVGIISIFEMIEVEEVFILSVDAPFVGEAVIEALYKEERENFDVVVAQSPNGTQPLCALYKRTILPLAYSQLDKGNHKLLNLLSLAKTLYVPFKEEQPFSNLNHPDEYLKALKTFEKHPTSYM